MMLNKLTKHPILSNKKQRQNIVSLDHHEECNSSVVHSIQQSYRSMADNLEHGMVGRDKMDEWEILETETGMGTDLDILR